MPTVLVILCIMPLYVITTTLIVVLYSMQYRPAVASDEHPLEILLESASEGRMAKLIMILRDGLTGSIDVSHYVCNTS